MSDKPLRSAAFRARALLLAARLDLRNWPEADTLARAPLTAKLAAGGIAVLFRYGVAVLFDVPAHAEHSLRERLAPLTEHRYRSPELEELEVRVDDARPEGLQDGALLLQSASLERLQLVAEALSKSVLLAHYETRFAADFDRIEPLALELERHGRIRGATREHLKRIGALLLIEHRMVGRPDRRQARAAVGAPAPGAPERAARGRVRDPRAPGGAGPQARARRAHRAHPR